MKNITHVGQVVVDLSYHGGSIRSAKGLHEMYEVRNVIEFTMVVSPDRPFDVNSAYFNSRSRTTRAEHGVYEWLRNVVPNYMNKCLITIGKPGLEEKWWPCAYQYDWHRVGFCEVKEKPKDQICQNYCATCGESWVSCQCGDV